MLGRLRPAVFSSLNLLLKSTTSLLATPEAGWGLPMPWCISSKREREDRAALLTHRWRSCNPGAAFVDQIQFKIRLGCSNKFSPVGDVETRPVSVTAESKQAKRAPTRPRWTIARQIEAHGILVLRECVQRRYRAGGVSLLMDDVKCSGEVKMMRCTLLARRTSEIQTPLSFDKQARD